MVGNQVLTTYLNSHFSYTKLLYMDGVEKINHWMQTSENVERFQPAAFLTTPLNYITGYRAGHKHISIQVISRYFCQLYHKYARLANCACLFNWREGNILLLYIYDSYLSLTVEKDWAC